MDPEENKGSEFDWEQVKDLLLAAEEEAPEDLDAWLRAHCANAAVREEVARLVRASAAAGNFLQGSASERHLGVPPPHPARIGRYRIIEELGSGGLGVVYAAQDEELERPVALKVLQAPEFSSSELRKRLLWDARAACKLQHPNIVVVHDVGQADGLDFVVMERVDGVTLDKIIPTGGLPTGRVVHIGLQILEGLEAAHNAKIVHRDLKPGNIMIGGNDTVKLLDFGLAKPQVPLPASQDSPKTIQGGFAGTAAYVSPEQADGKDVDSRADIFSFGCVLFEMLTGRQAFEGKSIITVVARILGQEPPKVSSVNPGIDPRLGLIVHRCLRKDRADRFQNVAELKERMSQCAAPMRTLLPPLSWRHTTWLGWTAFAAVVALACGITWLASRSPEVPIFPPAQLTRISGGGELSEDPAISPDGKLVAYASDRQSRNHLDIFIQDVKSGEPTPLTFGPANAYQPVFSPDGTRLVFRSDESGGGLYSVLTVGSSKPRLLVAGGRNPRFSPDGKWLAFWTGDEGYAMLQGSAQAMYIPSTGGEAKPVAENLEGSASPVWDPSGKTLLCVGRAQNDTRPYWWIVDFATHNARRTNVGGLSGMGMGLREPAGSPWMKPLAWLPDQTVLTAAQQGDATNIWGARISRDGKLLDAPRRWTAGTNLETHVSGTLDADGKPMLAYDSLRVTTSIRKVALSPSGRPAGPVEPLVEGYSGVGPASVSADGRKLAFSASEPRRRFIYMMDLVSGETDSVANRETLRSLPPLLSGDGRWLAYGGYSSGYIMSANGGSADEVCDHCGAPTDAGLDGSSMLFESGVTNELLACSRGGKQRPIAHVVDAPLLSMTDGRWSKDGRWILFGGTENRSKAVYLAPVTANGDVHRSQLVRISGAGYDAWDAVWSSDGQVVYFVATLDGFRCIWGQAIDPASRAPAGQPFIVAHFHKPRESVSGPLPMAGEFGLSAGPGLLVFTVAETIGDVWLRQSRPREQATN